MGVHPVAEDRHIGVGLRALAQRLGHEDDIGRLAESGELDDHGLSGTD
jgi:hypothetical protein